MGYTFTPDLIVFLENMSRSSSSRSAYPSSSWADIYQEAQLREANRLSQQTRGNLTQCLEKKRDSSSCFFEILPMLDAISAFIAPEEHLTPSQLPFSCRPSITEELKWMLLHPKAQEAFIQREDEEFKKCLINRSYPEETIECHETLARRVQVLLSVQKALCGGDRNTERNISARLESLVRNQFPFLSIR